MGPRTGRARLPAHRLIHCRQCNPPRRDDFTRALPRRGRSPWPPRGSGPNPQGSDAGTAKNGPWAEPPTEHDAAPAGEDSPPPRPTIEVAGSREAQVGGFRVQRALPRRGRRTVGACAFDHLGPASVSPERGLDVAPHPHLGLHTVTWLFTGEVVHRDSLGSEQVIRPGQVNLMTAGHGISHSEEGTGRYAGGLEGVQLWIAQPSDTRNGAPAFAHHPELPEVEMDGSLATVLIGEVAGHRSPARRDTDLVGIDLQLHGPDSVVPLRPEFEHGLMVCSGHVTIEGRSVGPGQFAYLGRGRGGVSTGRRGVRPGHGAGWHSLR